MVAFVGSVEMSEFTTALILSLFFLMMFIGGFWLGVHWQIGRDKDGRL